MNLQCLDKNWYQTKTVTVCGVLIANVVSGKEPFNHKCLGSIGGIYKCQKI
jgi:hypothetical protein